MSEDYTVGYGRPPEHTRFKPGTSGNPRGRPKKAPSLDGMQRKLLYGSKQVVRENGKLSRVCNLEALYKVLMAKALNGDLRAAEHLIKCAMALAAADAAKPERDLAAEGAELLREAIWETFTPRRGPSDQGPTDG